jgi:hypothetical protein
MMPNSAWFMPIAALLAALASPLSAQGNGRITGRVLDGSSGGPIQGAVVELVEVTPTRSTLSGIDGRYHLLSVPPGDVSLRVRLIGYRPKVVTGLTVATGAVVILDLTLDAETLQLAELTVTAEAERGSVASALQEQRLAINVVSAVTAEEIRRGPDGDAAAAVQRVSGVTVQGGKYVFVRGLGERYTTTSLNGSRIPSPEPERKVVPLDLFPANLLDGVSTSKTFTPDQPGDFSGANVDIRTREFPAERQFTLSMSTGVNSRVLGRTLPQAQTAGYEWLGFGSVNRPLPARVSGLDLASSPTQGQVNEAVASFRNAWTPRSGTGRPGSSLGLSAGGNDPVLGRPVGYLLSMSYSWDEEVQDDHVRARALAGSTPGDALEVDRYEGMTSRASVLWGGLLNLSTDLGPASRLTLNTTYNRSADNEARAETGESENLGQQFLIRRLRYVERSALSSQLAGEHQLGARHRVDWSASAARVTRDEPDRSEIVYQLDTDPFGAPLPPAWFSISNEGAVRTFAGLTETNWQGGVNYRLTFGGTRRPHALKLGALYRATDRTADNSAYAISATLDRDNQQLDPEEIFDGRFSVPGSDVFRLVSLGEGGSYGATDRLAAGYAMVQAFLSDRIEVVAGARLEQSRVTVDAAPTVGTPTRSEPSYTDLLPSLALNLSLTERQMLRFAASRTLSRPEYRELAPVLYREVIGGDNVLGNPELRRALIQNYDLRWEFYPRPNEVLSIGVFAKHFTDPIEQVYLATSGTRIITYLNAEGAWNHGVELEVRKSLDLLSPSLLPWSVFANATFMRSEIEIGEGLSSRLNDRRAMVGQAPYVVNTGLTWTSGSGRWSGTALYNVVGRRILSAGEAPLPDVYEEPRHMLDLSFRFPVVQGLNGKVDAKNLLDTRTEITQGAVTREAWYSGRRLAVGLSWTP